MAASRDRCANARCALAHHLVPAPVLRPRPQAQVLITETGAQVLSTYPFDDELLGREV
jgi:hypothetical protein